MAKWISIKERLPKDGEEVTVYLLSGQVKQAVRDSRFGGWKQPNCAGWEQAGGIAITHWTRAKLQRPSDGGWACGPTDAPWHKPSNDQVQR